MPLRVEGEVAGCVTIAFHDQRPLRTADRTFFEVLASHAAEALRRTRLWSVLRDVNETREAMIRSSPAGIVLTDHDGTVQVWNPAATHIPGLPRRRRHWTSHAHHARDHR